MDYYNFFKFLEKKRGMEIPLMARLAYKPESVSDNEFKNIGSNNVYNILIWVLRKRPELIDKFNLNKLNSSEISTVLRHQPQFIDKFDLNKLNGEQISWILEKQPQLIDKFNLDELDGDDVGWVLQYQPQLIDKLNVNKLTSDIIAPIIVNFSKSHEYIKRFPLEKLTHEDVEWILSVFPYLKSKFKSYYDDLYDK